MKRLGLFNGQHFEDSAFNLLHLCRIFDFLAVEIPDVKHIDHLVHHGRDLGDPHIQAALKQGMGHAVQKSCKIMGKNLDDGKKI